MIGLILALLGIDLEESGIPMPVPSEVSIGYLGHRLSGNPVELLGLWLALSLWITLGSLNLFMAARWFGPRLLGGRLATALHLTPARVDQAARWFRRWGPFAIGAARFVPGLRWAMAVACGSLRVPARTFCLSTAGAAALWSGLLLTLGSAFGDAVARALGADPWLLMLLPVPALTVLTVGAFRLLITTGAAAFPRPPLPRPVTFGRPEVLKH